MEWCISLAYLIQLLQQDADRLNRSLPQVGGRHFPSLWAQSVPTSMTDMVNKTHTLKNTCVAAERNSPEPIYMLALGWLTAVQQDKFPLGHLKTCPHSLVGMQNAAPCELVKDPKNPWTTPARTPMFDMQIVLGTSQTPSPVSLTARQNLSLTKERQKWNCL